MLQHKTSITVLLYNVPGTTYCIGLLSLKNCTDYVYLIDLASVNNFNISRYIIPGNILTKCDFLEAVMIIGIHVQPPANPLFQFSEIINAVLTYLTTEFINHLCHSSPQPILQVYSILYNSMFSRWGSVFPTLGINFAVFRT